MQFTQESAQRIARVVRGVETSVAPSSPLTFEPFFPPKKGGGGVLICLFSGGWPKGQTKVVTLLNDTTTATAYNVFGNIGTSASLVRHCAIAKYQTAFYMIQAECD